MEPTLVGVTGFSLVMAVVMSLVAWRLLRLERDRSAARVEALEALAIGESRAEAAPASPAPMRTVETAARREAIARTAALPESHDAHDALDEFEDSDEEPPAPADWDLALGAKAPGRPAIDVAHAPVAAAPLFEQAPVSSPAGRRWLALAAVAVAMSAGAYAVSTGRLTGLVSSVAASSLSASTAPLELLSLRHAEEPDGTFTVTGLVENPREGRTQSGLIAVVYLFDAHGQYFASGRSTLDVSAFRPGDESPFVVKVPNATGVSRYRVGFRTGDGAVVVHVDRRGQLPDGTTGDAIGTGSASGATPGADIAPARLPRAGDDQ